MFGDVYLVQGPNDLNITKNQNLLKGENIADINIFLYMLLNIFCSFSHSGPHLCFMYIHIHTHSHIQLKNETYAYVYTSLCICSIFTYILYSSAM